MKPYDHECQKLARYFLSDLASDRLVAELASHIQESVEDWIDGERDRLRAELERQQMNPE